MRKYLLWIILSLILFFRIYFYYALRQVIPDGTKVRITDKLLSEPIKYSNSQYLELSGYKIYLPLYPEVSYGDEVIVEGLVQDQKLESAKLIEIKEKRGFLIGLREKILNFYERGLPTDHSGLISGVVLGSKSQISKDFWEVLKKTGTAHVVVASGMNVTLVASFLMAFLILFMQRGKAIFFSITGIWLYSFLSGFDAPIIRASVMGSLVFTAQWLGRLSFAYRNLLLTLFIMLFFNPSWITDLGFILSFVATLSILLFESKIYRKIYFVPTFFREGLSTSLAAQIGVAPIIYATFGQFNILSPVINALILWTIAPISLIGIFAGIGGIFFEPFAKGLLFLSYPLTSWFIFIVQIFS